jgi:hypothetical protein
MAGGTMEFHRNDYSQRALVGMSKKGNTKSKTPLKGKTGASLAPMRLVFPKMSLTMPTSS